MDNQFLVICQVIIIIIICILNEGCIDIKIPGYGNGDIRIRGIKITRPATKDILDSEWL